MPVRLESNIPREILDQILQSKSAIFLVVALLNEIETKYSKLLKKTHGNAKRVYPYWKVCQICSNPFQTHTMEQAVRNKTCSKVCKRASIGKSNTGSEPIETHKGKILVSCFVCGKKFYRNAKHAKRVGEPVCSYQCNGQLRGQELKHHAHKARAAWSEEAEASFREKMSGPNNHAWRGGVTKKRSKGNYRQSPVVRCPEEFLDMAFKSGLISEHRLAMATKIGRPLTRTEVVHHINHDTSDNRINNLMLFANNSDHKRFENGYVVIPLWQPW